MGEDLTIELKDLKSGISTGSWDVSCEFFKDFGNEEVRAALLHVEASARKSGEAFLVDVDLKGSLTVPCDRCLEDVTLPVQAKALLKLRFGEGESSEEDGREVQWLPTGESEYNLSQVVYDYALLALPLQRLHPEGECDPEALRYLTDDPGSEQSEPQSPFAGLKDLLG